MCANGLDDDGDGAIDYPADTGCEGPAVSGSEVGPCGADGADRSAQILKNIGDLLGARAVPGHVRRRPRWGYVFLYVVEHPLELVFSTINADTQIPTVLYLRQQCGRQRSAMHRGPAAGPSWLIEQPAVGRYYLFVDSGGAGCGGGDVPADEVDAVPISDAATNRQRRGWPGWTRRIGCVETEDADETDPDPLPSAGTASTTMATRLIDYPDDPECHFAGTDQELRLCPAGVPTTSPWASAGALRAAARDGRRGQGRVVRGGGGRRGGARPRAGHGV
ncbi:MAG: hypothetical protein R3F43_18160 [bacterium]